MAALGATRWLIVLVAYTAVTSGDDQQAIYPTTEPNDGVWWANKIIYQVYPRSFKDSDGDGIGDLKGIDHTSIARRSFAVPNLSRTRACVGITQQLDYFVELGVEIVWINPIFKSPMDDMGYDVENYTVIDPIFGTMDDFDELISEMNKRSERTQRLLNRNHTPPCQLAPPQPFEAFCVLPNGVMIGRHFIALQYRFFSTVIFRFQIRV